MELVTETGPAATDRPRRHPRRRRGPLRARDPRARLVPGGLRPQLPWSPASTRSRSTSGRRPTWSTSRGTRCSTCGFALLGLAAWFGLLRLRRRDPTESRWFLRGASVGRDPRDRRHGERLDRDRGRAPAVDRLGSAADGGRGDRRRWRRCLAPRRHDPLLALGIATIVVLRALSRRWNGQTISAADLPYGPTGK